MVQRKLKKLLAFALSILMLSSSMTGLFPTAAAEEPDAVTAPADTAAQADAVTATGSRLEFDAPDNGRPNLFVDFLGDNASFQPTRAGTPQLNTLVTPAGFDQSQITNPNAIQTTTPVVTDPDNPNNQWAFYGTEHVTPGGSTIFWVGLGIDRREVFELLAGGKGLTGIEAGFYYDNRYIEPYVDDTGDYKTTIQKANIDNKDYPDNTQWSADYEILRAETGLEPQTDRITQEELTAPSIDQILSNSDGGDWKMTYVSLELTDLTKPRRLQDGYVGVDNLPKDSENNPITPAAAHGTGMQGKTNEVDNDYQYLLLIPFRLKQYGSPDHLCLRLMRDATHFSIGGGEEGTQPYAAWERVTTRNPGKDIKLLTRFTGDLNLFKGGRAGEVDYSAKLIIETRGGSGNYAKLSVDGDPAVWPVYADTNQEVITGLRSGLGMKLETTVMSGYTVTVTVRYWNDGKLVIHNYTTVVKEKEYTFVMPTFAPTGVPLEVEVIFDRGDISDFGVYLSELQQTDGGGFDATQKVGNETSITTNLDASGAATATSQSISTFSPVTAHPAHPASSGMYPHNNGPMCTATQAQPLRIDVSTHADYEAVVRIFDFSAGKFIATGLTVDTGTRNDHTIDAVETLPGGGANPHFGEIILPYGGTITLPMPSSDIDVEVVYRKAQQNTATLEVFHPQDDPDSVPDMNTAQLVHLVYDDENVASRAYSGVVFEDKDIPETAPYSLPRHRALKAVGKQLPWITNAQSALSLSLGGDTDKSGAPRKGAVWNPAEVGEDLTAGPTTVMARLSAANVETDFQGSLSALDVNTQTVTPGGAGIVGLRKDLQGNTYGESDVASLEALLWEMRGRIMNDAALQTLYRKTVTTTTGSTTTTAYTYLDLTPAQVQAYLLEVLEAQETYRVANLQYRDALRLYQTAKAVYDRLSTSAAMDKLTKPEEPAKPQEMTVDATTFVRTYQGTDYHNVAGATAADNGYLWDYNEYIANYQAFIDSVEATGALSGDGVVPLTKSAPAAKPVKTVSILSDGDAVAKVGGLTWKKPSVIASGAEAHTIRTRRKRTVWVAMEADSAYTYKNVEIYSKNPLTGAANTLLETITPAANNTGYRNVVSFTMPSQDCVVRVNYVKRETRDIRVQIIGADGEKDNLASVEAYRVTDHNNPNYPGELPATTPTLEIISNDGHQSENRYPGAPAVGDTKDERFIYQVLQDGTVTIRVKRAKGYKVNVTATNYPSNTSVPILANTAGDVRTFTVLPGGATDQRIDVNIVYEKDADTHDAFISYETGGATGASADWHLEDAGGTVTLTNVIRNVSEGTHLLADIVVPPGAHIYGVVVYGASGNYPYTLSGNGYNGGYGAGGATGRDPEHIWVDMPDEDLYVHVEFRPGIPDPEPMNTLTLTVKDDDNTTGAENWAKATVYDAEYDIETPPATLPAVYTDLGEVGKSAAHGNGTLTDWDFVPTGKWVKVEFDADEGFYVSKVTVGPSHLGVTTVWENSNTISFYMPAGSTGVNVEFKSGKATPYFLTVRETWMDANFQDVPDTDPLRKGNYITTADSTTIRSWNVGNPITDLREDVNPERVPSTDKANATGAAVPGEIVTLNFNVDVDNWYVQSVVILSDGAAYRGAFYDTNRTTTANGRTYHVYEVKFRQPTGDAEVTVHYRKGQRPDIEDYAFTAILYDDDNQGPAYDDNRLDITISGNTGHTHADVHLGRLQGNEMNAVRHPHAGDLIQMTTTLQPGYSIDYLVIDPASLKLYPVWQASTTDPVTKATVTQASFTMPARGVAVIARYVKGDPQKYTANLILRPPAGMTIDKVGRGSFTDPTNGELDMAAYPGKAVFSTTQPTGTQIGYDLYAFDGYYIDHVSIDPAVGATGSLSGSFGYQNGDFVMPGANVNVNVWFKKGWPDEVKYDLTLEVVDSAYSADKTENNWASFRQVRRPDGTLTDLTGTGKVYGQNPNTKTLEDAAYDRDTVFVDIHAVAGYYTNAQNIRLTDTFGNSIPWWSVPGGIAFTMPPRSTTVRVTFLPILTDRTPYTADLVLENAAAGDEARLATTAANATPSSIVNTNGTITQLYADDVLTLSAKPGTDRHISAVYAVVTSGVHAGEVVPIYDASGALSSFIPGDPAAAVEGSLAMPEGNVTVHVRYDDGAITSTDKSVTLIVSGPADSGDAAAQVETGRPTPGMTVAATGAETRFAPQDSAVTVTFRPDTANDYQIAKLEVYDKTGKAVPYEWVSMLPDTIPPASTSTWPPPPNRPGSDIDYSGFHKNGELQIKLTVPVDSVVIHVTYAKVDPAKTYRAQVVVNDEAYPASATVQSRNNAWLRTAASNVQEKLKNVAPGAWVDLDLLVHPGYRIEYIVVIPQSFGISPGMPLEPYYDQTTGFVMPEGDVTVYVKFTTDGLDKQNATLVVTGAPTNNPGNFATISSPISGKSPNVYVNDPPRSVQARPNMDWITVDYAWDTATSSIASITVKTTAGVDVPFTQNAVDLVNGTGQIILPMATQDVIVTVTYRNDPEPVRYDVILHVLDHTAAGTLDVTQAYGQIDCAVGTPATSGQVEPDPNPGQTFTMTVPAGQSVDVSAWWDATVTDLKLEAAYVIYEQGGQMVNLNLPNTGANPAADSFLTHPGRNDVYVAFTDKNLPTNPHTAVLMLKAPEDNAGSAGISAGGVYGTGYDQDSLSQANHGYASVVAGEGDMVHINVIPNSGYIIDHILVTPLGFPLETAPAYAFTQNGNAYSFHMPHCNVAITVYLKRGTNSNARVILHYLQDPDLNNPRSQVEDYAKLSWQPAGGPVHAIWADDNPNAPAGTTGVDAHDWGNVSDMMVQVGAEVTLSATLDTNATTGRSDAILAAYVLWNGALVPLTPKHPADRNGNTGLEGVEENASQTDNAQADAVATFIMPDTNKDVDVFLITTNVRPAEDWHTIVVVATDTAPWGNNLGQNKGYLKQEDEPDSARRTALSYGHMVPMPPATDNNTPAHAIITLPQYKDDGSPNYYTVVTEAAAGYEFKPLKSGLTKNTPVYAESLTPAATLPTYRYREPVGDSNRVVHLVFESSAALKLTVEIEDRDNPGDGTVTNVVDTTTTGVDTLHLTSESALGSYQIMSGVTAAAPVNFEVDPEPGYSAMAQLRTGGETTYLPLTPVGGGSDHLRGSFTMPANDSILTVTFFRAYNATLVLEDLTTSQTHKAMMTESTQTPPDTVNVTTLDNAKTLTDLPNRTELTAQMVDFDKSGPEKVTGFVTVGGSTTLLPGVPLTDNHNDPDGYLHTIDRANATITLVVQDVKDANTDPYLAAVETKNKPSGVADPTISTSSTGQTGGTIWTTANPTDTVTVHVTVPAGYAVDVTAVRTDNNGNVLTSTPITLTADGDAAFTMPAANVQVTVTYRKVQFDLTLRIVDTSGQVNTTQVTPTTGWVSGKTPLTDDGDQAVVTAGGDVTVSAAADTNAMVRSITVQPAVGDARQLIAGPLGLGDSINTVFDMPAADTVVTIVYDKERPGTPDDPAPYYTAYSALKYEDGSPSDPGNRITFIRNNTRNSLDDGTALPKNSPYWTAGYPEDSVTVSYETANGYYVTATAVRHNSDGTTTDIPVALLDHGSGGTATASFPKIPGSDITITIHYSTKTPPPVPPKDVALQLIGHARQTGNQAATSAVSGTLNGLSLDGTHPDHAPGYTQPDDPVEKQASAASIGDDLRTLAGWANGYQIIRMTVAVRRFDPTDPDNPAKMVETGEMDLLVSRYSGSATSRVVMPAVGDNEIPVIRVYYGNIYEATLHIIPDGAGGRDVNGNETKATDSRTRPVSSTGTVPINATGDKLIGFSGDGSEQVRTTAIPSAANNQRLVGVVWESASTGAAGATPNVADTTDPRYSTDNRYNFTMPPDDVDFYAIYETEPTDPKDKSYIAKVNFTADSAHLGDADNAVTITNTSDTAAAHGTYWTAAKGGQAITVNVKVADGYKAQIVTTHADKETGHTGEHYDFYTTRTAFVPNLTAGRDASFTMPAGTDATVTIRFVKGYDLSLEVKDVSGHASAAAPNKAEVTTGETPARKLQGENTQATNAPTYMPNDPAHTKNGLPTHENVPWKTDISTAVTKADPDDTLVRVQRNSPFTGTVTIPTNAAGGYDPYAMPAEDVEESVLFYEDPNTLFANVALKGHSDINGNTAKPIVDRDPTSNALTGRATGSVWTATVQDNKIDLTVTVADGYLAKIKVRWDNKKYTDNPNDPDKWDYLNPAEFAFDAGTGPVTDPAVDLVQMGFTAGTGKFGAYISDPQHFTFTMPDYSPDPADPTKKLGPTDVTVLVEFVFAGNIPQPFDPRNVKDDDYDRKPSFLEQGFIYGENRGDFAVVEIPTLIKEPKSGEELFDTDNYDKPTGGAAKDAKSAVKFSFFLYDGDKDEYTPLTLGTDIRLEPFDTEDTGTYTANDPYNYYRGDQALWKGPEHWHGSETTDTQFVGSKFKLVPTEPNAATGKRTDGAEKLFQMLHDKKLGSLAKDAEGSYYTRLAVIAEDTIGQKSAYTEVWVRPFFTIQVGVISYAPNHETVGKLYHLMTQEELDKASGYAADNTLPRTNQDIQNFAHYRWDDQTKPFVENSVVYEGEVLGANKYYQRLELMSSELLGSYTSAYDPGAKTLLANLEPGYDPRYALTLEKASHVTYTRVDLDLMAGVDLTGATPVFPSYYTDYIAGDNDNSLIYAVSDIIYLFNGDVNGDGFTKWQDYDTVYSYVWRNIPWNNTQTEAPDPTDTDYNVKQAKWLLSTYNPESLAYRCDLNGDRVLTYQDVQLVQTAFDYNRSKEDYLWTEIKTKERRLPFGFDGSVKDPNATGHTYAALFGLWRYEPDEPIPVEPDSFWSKLVDPEETEALPLENPYVDDAGNLWSTPEAQNAPPARPSTPEPALPPEDEEHGAVMEVPEGDEAMELPELELDLAAELPVDINMEE